MDTEWNVGDIARLPNGALRVVGEAEVVGEAIYLRLDQATGDRSAWVLAEDCERVA